MDEMAIVSLVQQERRCQPRLGGRKLMRLLRAELAEMGIRIGRDRFFNLLSANNLLIERERRSGRTTNSAHGFRKWPNLLKWRELTGANQAWVCDATYVGVAEAWVYVWLIMDAWSRKIVGYALAENLEAEGAVEALRMAIRQLPEGVKPIHHSDRGIQYCCGMYMEVLREHGLEVSMTEDNHCYENAKAERLNGILKQEYGLGGRMGTKEDVRKMLDEAVCLYNTRRPHVSLNYRIPEEVHRQAA